MSLWRGKTADVISYFLALRRTVMATGSFVGNWASGGAAGASVFLCVFSLDYARARPANDAKAVKKGREATARYLNS